MKKERVFKTRFSPLKSNSRHWSKTPSLFLTNILKRTFKISVNRRSLFFELWQDSNIQQGILPSEKQKGDAEVPVRIPSYVVDVMYIFSYNS